MVFNHYNYGLKNRIYKMKTKFILIYLKIKILIIIFLNLCTLNAQQFKDIAKEIGINHYAFDPMIMTSGVAVFDYNNDGLEDIYMVSGVPIDHLYRNNGDGTFTNVTIEAGFGFTRNFRTCGVATGDINNDGYRDVFITIGGNLPDILMLNNGDGTFKNISKEAGINVGTFGYAVTFGDFDLDGYLDIYVGNYGPSPGEPGMRNVLYRNNGDLTFTNVTDFHGVGDKGCALAMMFVDIDNDNDLDLLVINDIGNVYEPNVVYEWVQEEQRYKNISITSGFNLAMYGMGIANHDINEDGYFDHYVTNIRHNAFFINMKNKTFEDRARKFNLTYPFLPDTLNPDYKFQLESTSWGPIFMDFDHDSYDDLFVTTGHVQTPEKFLDPDKVLKNINNTTFVDVSFDVGFSYPLRSRGFAKFDYDNDGDMDLIVNVVDIVNQTDIKSMVYRNDLSNGKNWLKIKLIGSSINRDAFGSKVKVFFKDRMVMKQVDAGGGSYCSQSSPFMHWGLNDESKVDSIVIEWLGGQRKVLKNVNTNQSLTIIQDYFNNLSLDLCQGEIFDNKKIDKDQIYVKTFKANNGADSIVTYDIKVKYNKITNQDKELCAGTEYKGKKIYKDIVLEEVYTAENGCDSTNFVNIKVLPTQQSEESIYLCYGEELNGKKYFQSETNSQNFPSSLGCDSIHITNIVVFEENVKSIKVFLDEDRKFKGIYYDNDTTIIEHYKDHNGCDSIVTITLETPLGIENTDIVDLIYPNPISKTNDYLKIKFNSDILKNNSHKITFKIIDNLGNILTNNIKININNANEVEIDLKKIIDTENINISINCIYYLSFELENYNYYYKLLFRE